MTTPAYEVGFNPTGWQFIPFFDVLDFKGGNQPPKQDFIDLPRPGYVRLLQIRDFTSDEKAVYIQASKKWQTCSEEDILIGRYGASVGRVLRGKSGAYNVALIKMIIKDSRINREFLYYWLHDTAFQNTLLSVSRSAQNGFNKEDLKGLAVPVPPLAEQRRIVARIEALFARTRRARTDLERIAPLSAQYQKSLLEAVFFQDNEGSDSSYMRPFFDVLDFKGGTQPPKATFSETPESGFIRLLQIRDFASDNKAIYIKDSSNWSKCAAHDILVGRYGASVGKILRGKAGAYNVALVKMIADWTRVDRDYLFNWLQSPAFQNCVLGVSRSAQNGFNKGDLANLTFPLLDLASQKSLSRRLEAASNAGKAITRDAKHALALLDRLEQSILARAFRGELVSPSSAKEQDYISQIQVEKDMPATRRRKVRAVVT